MLQKISLGLLLFALSATQPLTAQENFVGSFAEPKDGGNLDTALSTFDGSTVVIVPRAHASEAVSGATKWRNVLFAIRGMQGRNPAFLLRLTSPGSGKVILSSDSISFQNIKLVWSYQPNSVKWNTFTRHARTGSSASTWKVEAKNDTSFDQDVVYVSINEHFPVADFYEWLEADVFTHAFVRPTASESAAGTFVIGYQSGAPASAAFSRAIPDMPLFGFVIKDPAASGTKLVMLVSGQHPYEGQNKVALQAAVDWILHSSSDAAKAYRAHYTTIVYPFVNPTGELAGLWRGTAYQPSKDTNRNWHTTETVPSRNRGIDTVIVHKNAMKKDIAALGLGEPYAIFDYHQNFGDHPEALDYLLHSTLSVATTASISRKKALSDYAPYFARLSTLTTIADMPSDLTTQETLRGYMVARGATLPLTFERSVYNTIPSEWAFGAATVQALVDSEMIARVVPIEPEVPVEPAPPPSTEPAETTPVAETLPPVINPPADPVTPPAPPPAEILPDVLPPAPPPPIPLPQVLVDDDFSGTGSLNTRIPGIAPASGLAWSIETGSLKLDGKGSLSTSNSARAVINASSADVEVTSVLTLGSSGTGLILRSSDASNYLRFTLTTTSWMLQKTARGVITMTASGKGAFPLNAKYSLKASLSGNSIVLTVNDVIVGTATERFNASATRHGVISSGSGGRSWDSFTVRRL